MVKAHLRQLLSFGELLVDLFGEVLLRLHQGSLRHGGGYSVAVLAVLDSKREPGGSRMLWWSIKRLGPREGGSCVVEAGV